MENKYMQFSIENISMSEDNDPSSQFATAKIQAFSSDKNRHNLICSEETLKETAPSIYNKPILYSIDNNLDDFYTHVDPSESLICGFVVPNSAEFIRLPDSRLSLNIMAKIWKRYAPKVMELFKRDEGHKKVSVEMEVFKLEPIDNVFSKMVSFAYTGICILGSFVTEAVPGANIKMLSFSEENDTCKSLLEKEFGKKENLDEFPSSNIIIPNKIRSNAEKGLKYRKNRGDGQSAGVAFARYLTNNKIIPPDKIREMSNYFTTHKHVNSNKNEVVEENTDWLLWGGDFAKDWAEKMVIKMDEIVTFPYKSITDINPALKGITPSVSLAQANAIAKQADSIGSDEGKNGWAIAISSFKKSHHVEDEKWVKNEGSTARASADEPALEENNEVFVTTDVKEESDINKKEMAMTMTDEEKLEKAALEEKIKKYAEEAEKKDAELNLNKGELLKFSETFASVAEQKKAQLETMSKFFSDDEDADDVKMAKAEIAKGDEADFGLVLGAAYAKFCKMQAEMAAFAEEKKVYMAENEELKKFKAELDELKKFKADIEVEQKKFAINETLKELSISVYLPDDEKAVMIKEAENYTLENIEIWKNFCKAKAYEFAIRQPKNPSVIEVGLPFAGQTKKKDDLWG